MSFNPGGPRAVSEVEGELVRLLLPTGHREEWSWNRFATEFPQHAAATQQFLASFQARLQRFDRFLRKRSAPTAGARRVAFQALIT